MEAGKFVQSNILSIACINRAAQKDELIESLRQIAAGQDTPHTRAFIDAHQFKPFKISMIAFLKGVNNSLPSVALEVKQ
jgi:hypothetical protein